MKITFADRSGVKRAGLYIILFSLMVLFPGCDDPSVLTQPRLIFTDNGAVLVVRQLTINNSDNGFLLIQAKNRKLKEWSEPEAQLASAVGLYKDDKTFCVVYKDGTVVSFYRSEGGEGQSNILVPKMGKADLLFARKFLDKVYAVDFVDGQLKVMILGDGRWADFSPKLPVTGEVRLAEFAFVGNRLCIFWISGKAGGNERMKAAVLLNGEWERLRNLPNSVTGYFSVTESGKGLVLASDNALRDDHSKTGEISIYRFDGNEWERSEYPIRLQDELRKSSGRGISLARNSYGGMAVVRSDSSGVHVFFAGADDQNRWVNVATPVKQKSYGAAGDTFLMLALVSGLFLLVVTRYMRRRALDMTGMKSLVKPGRFAQPVERALALVIDGVIATPFSLGYMYAVVGTVDQNGISQEIMSEMMVVLTAAMLIYMTFTEYMWGASLGKMAVGIRIRSAMGGRASFGQIFIRNLLRLVDFFPIPIFGVPVPYLVALVAVSITRRRQRVGDIFGRTVVRRHVPLERRKIVLASSSLRRREILERMGITSFEIIPPNTDEIPDSRRSPEENTLVFASDKAENVVLRLSGDELVIAADTIVAFEGEVIGKPVDRIDARAILRKLSGKSHMIITAIAIADRATGQRIISCEHTEVVMKEMTDGEIDSYVESGEADGKAGAYAIQETGDRYVQDVFGSFSNVVGLPVELLSRMLGQIDG